MRLMGFWIQGSDSGVGNHRPAIPLHLPKLWTKLAALGATYAATLPVPLIQGGISVCDFAYPFCSPCGCACRLSLKTIPPTTSPSLRPLCQEWERFIIR